MWWAARFKRIDRNAHAAISNFSTWAQIIVVAASAWPALPASYECDGPTE
jgi:hypothetical protein